MKTIRELYRATLSVVSPEYRARRQAEDNRLDPAFACLPLQLRHAKQQVEASRTPDLSRRLDEPDSVLDEQGKQDAKLRALLLLHMVRPRIRVRRVTGYWEATGRRKDGEAVAYMATCPRDAAWKAAHFLLREEGVSPTELARIHEYRRRLDEAARESQLERRLLAEWRQDNAKRERAQRLARAAQLVREFGGDLRRDFP